MKFLSILIVSLTVLNACGTANLSKANKNTIENIIVFEYMASSRNSFNQIKATKETIIYSKKRGEVGVSKPLNNSNWNTLLELLNPIPLETLSKLEIPSKAFQFDGDARGLLKITLNGKTYETPPFDNGNPPKEIKPLIKELLSISENIE